MAEPSWGQRRSETCYTRTQPRTDHCDARSGLRPAHSKHGERGGLSFTRVRVLDVPGEAGQLGFGCATYSRLRLGGTAAHRCKDHAHRHRFTFAPRSRDGDARVVLLYGKALANAFVPIFARLSASRRSAQPPESAPGHRCAHMLHVMRVRKTGSEGGGAKARYGLLASSMEDTET